MTFMKPACFLFPLLKRLYLTCVIVADNPKCTLSLLLLLLSFKVYSPPLLFGTCALRDRVMGKQECIHFSSFPGMSFILKWNFP